MTATTATRPIDSRARMMVPLAVFFLACFLIAGAIKFNLKGGDLWLARPAGAPVTCLFLAMIGMLAGRWFFGARPDALPKFLLAALVVLLPVMGLLGVVQLATHDPISAAQDGTPLGGALGSMLAGPRAFGALGTTVAGITFALLSLFGGYLARRITTGEPGKRDDPYALMRTMNTRRGAGQEGQADDGGVAVAEAEPKAEARRPRGGELFPVDVELEPEPATSTGATPLDAVEEVAEAPRRVRILTGIVEQADEEEETPAPPFLAAELLLSEPEPEEAAAVPLDEVEARPAPEPEPAPEPVVEEEPVQREIHPAPPSVEGDDESSASEGDDEDDPMDDESELGLVTGGEAPELTPEWIAAPSQFHTPRLVRDELPINEALSLFDILDVERAPAPEAPEVEVRKIEEPVEAPAPVQERPRFRVKADFVRDDEVITEAPAVEEPDALDRRLQPAPAPIEVEAQIEIPVEDAAVEEVTPVADAPVAPASRPAEEMETVDAQAGQEPGATGSPPAEIESQLSLPSMPEPAPSTEDAEKDSKRPRRRMRSAAKDWASWDDPGSRERPRLRLVKDATLELPVDAAAEAPSAAADAESADSPAAPSGDDPYERAVSLVVAEDRCSVSLLQRNLGVTFGEATALIDRMYQQGIVGPYQPTGRRDVLKKGASAEEG